MGLLGKELTRNGQMCMFSPIPRLERDSLTVIDMGTHGHVLTVPIEQGKPTNVIAFRTKADGTWEDDQWVKAMSM